MNDTDTVSPSDGTTADFGGLSGEDLINLFVPMAIEQAFNNRELLDSTG